MPDNATNVKKRKERVHKSIYPQGLRYRSLKSVTEIGGLILCFPIPLLSSVHRMQSFLNLAFKHKRIEQRVFPYEPLFHRFLNRRMFKDTLIALDTVFAVEYT